MPCACRVEHRSNLWSATSRQNQWRRLRFSYVGEAKGWYRDVHFVFLRCTLSCVIVFQTQMRAKGDARIGAKKAKPVTEIGKAPSTFGAATGQKALEPE